MNNIPQTESSPDLLNGNSQPDKSQDAPPVRRRLIKKHIQNNLDIEPCSDDERTYPLVQRRMPDPAKTSPSFIGSLLECALVNALSVALFCLRTSSS